MLGFLLSLDFLAQILCFFLFQTAPSTHAIFIYPKVVDSRWHASVIEVDFGDGTNLRLFGDGAQKTQESERDREKERE